MNWYFKLVANHPFFIVFTIGALSGIASIVSITCSKLPNFSDPQLGFETRGTDIAKRLTTWENLYEALRPSGILTVNPLGDRLIENSSVGLVPNKVNNVRLKGNKNESSRNSLFFNVESNKSKVFTAVSITTTTTTLAITLHQKTRTTHLRSHTRYFTNQTAANIVSGKIQSLCSSADDAGSCLVGETLGVASKVEFDDRLSDKDSTLEESRFHHKTHDYGQDHDHEHLSSDGFFCEGLSPDYSHIVLETVDQSQSLLTLDALYSICIIQQKLMNHDIMSSICQTVSTGHCCNSWSLPNYITLLYNHTTCLDLTENDITEFKRLLLDCANFFNNLKISSDCHESGLCHSVPSRCTKFNAVYNILYYLTDIGFLPTDYNHTDVILNQTMIYLPIARSSAILPYYYNLSQSDLRHRNIHITAMDLGLKNALFNDCLLRDAFLMIAGGGFMVLCIWYYTNSLLITVSTVLAIVMSLINSYFIYTFLFKIKFFPFMNLLAIVVAIGIGADDAFIFYKMWECFRVNQTNSPVVNLVAHTLKHSAASMFVTSLTTAAAFYSSYISSITAINCFSIFAGTAVLANFLLMVTWLPACFVISQKSWCFSFLPHWSSKINKRIRVAQKHSVQMKAFLDSCLVSTIVRLKWLWLFLFAAVAIASAFVVLYHPKFRLPDSRNFHLFQSSHLFEKYDAKYREKFWFERLEKIGEWENTNFKLPLRFVWGVFPVDNGNYLEPDSKGTLEFDSTFDVAAPESQMWLLNFCRLLRAQPFYQSTLGPLLPNCFIESFISWMHRRCRDAFNQTNRYPCCESSTFPYSRDVFQSCIVEAMADLYETPADYFLPGMAGPKFSKTKKGEIVAVIVEYDSNQSYSMSFKDVHMFFSEVETWFQHQLSIAPAGLKNGWFVSHLDFYDLQLSLSDGTAVAIGASMAISLAVFFLVTLNILISIYTIIAISCIIFVTVAILVLIGWSLNVLESVAVTTAIGLAVDFSLHYGIAYRLSGENGRDSAVAFTISKMGGPTLMAALTTGAAGVFMLPSSVLAYIQIGVFLIIVMGSSWLYSTIFLMSLLSVAGPKKGFGQFSYARFFCRENIVSKQSNKPYTNVFSDSLLSTSSNKEVVTHESHELEALTSQKKIQCSAETKIEI